MKSVLSKEPCEKSEKPFPKLMISTNGKNLIILFTGKETGTVVYNGGSYYKVGDHADDWGDFEDFEGSVCLSND